MDAQPPVDPGALYTEHDSEVDGSPRGFGPAAVRTHGVAGGVQEVKPQGVAVGRDGEKGEGGRGRRGRGRGRKRRRRGGGEEEMGRKERGEERNIKPPHHTIVHQNYIVRFKAKNIKYVAKLTKWLTEWDIYVILHKVLHIELPQNRASPACPTTQTM